MGRHKTVRKNACGGGGFEPAIRFTFQCSPVSWGLVQDFCEPLAEGARMTMRACDGASPSRADPDVLKIERAPIITIVSRTLARIRSR